MNMQPFEIHIQLATPACIHPGLTLDALLAAALYRTHGDIDTANTDLPLKQTDGIWHGSTVKLGAGLYDEQPYVARLTSTDLDPSGYSDQRRRGGGITVNLAGGVFSPQLRTLRTFLGEIAFYGCGDVAQVRRLLDVLPGIGKNVNQGLGRIAHSWIEPIAEDRSLVDANGLPNRPVPRHVWEGWGYASAESAMDDVSFRPPYWDAAGRTLCVVPG